MAVRDENTYFNAAYKDSSRSSVWKYYALIECSRKFYRKYLFTHCDGQRVLEYGCGIGSHAFDLARHGAQVIGVDISDVAITKATDQAQRKKLTAASFVKMDAENMTFPDRHFNLVCGTAILHHLELDTAMKELARVLTDDGCAAFLEPMGHNPALNLFRMLTPKLRTKDEHPLMVRDVDLIRGYFEKSEIHYFTLFSMISAPFINTRFFQFMLQPLERFDQLVFRLIPWLGHFAWYSAIILSEPKRTRPV